MSTRGVCPTPGSFKIYTRLDKLEPATRSNLDRFGFDYWGTYDPYAILSQRYELESHKDQQKKIKPIQTNLDWAKKCYMNLNKK
jgi:hypothetical protein